jgi:Leucine-rich repeat (LRR) protein
MVKAFGPAPSRRLGRSQGINNNPLKVYAYSSIHCQLRNTVRWRYLIPLVLVALVFSACATPAPPPAPAPTEIETVVFLDGNLEAAIRYALNKPAGEAITATELAGLTELDAAQRGISNLSGIEYCTELTNLYISYNQISDISPLVDNSGLGEGDQLDLGINVLDLSEGSEDLQDIRQLEGRGVMVYY